MNEKKKGLVVLSTFLILLVVIILLIGISVINSNKKINEFKNMVNSSDTHIVYFMKPTCYYCNLLEPITTMLKEQYNLKYEMIDASTLSNSQLSSMLNILDVDISTFGTPYIAIVKDGMVLGEQSGYTDEDVLFELFKKNGLIKAEETLKLNYIDKDTLNAIWDNGEKRAILIGQAGNTSSIAARIELMDLLNEYAISVDYFDTSDFSTEAEYNTWIERLDADKFPVLVVMESGNIVAKISDIDKNKYIEFLNQNGYIK